MLLDFRRRKIVLVRLQLYEDAAFAELVERIRVFQDAAYERQAAVGAFEGAALDQQGNGCVDILNRDRVDGLVAENAQGIGFKPLDLPFAVGRKPVSCREPLLRDLPESLGLAAPLFRQDKVFAPPCAGQKLDGLGLGVGKADLGILPENEFLDLSLILEAQEPFLGRMAMVGFGDAQIEAGID